MNPTRTMWCARCHALGWVDEWREDRNEMMSVTLGPCGHTIELSARLEWAIPPRYGRRSRPVHIRLVNASLATW